MLLFFLIIVLSVLFLSLLDKVETLFLWETSAVMSQIRIIDEDLQSPEKTIAVSVNNIQRLWKF